MFDEIITKWAMHYRVPEAWIRATIQTESAWDPKAYRAEPQINDASRGLMQLLYRTAAGLGFESTPDELYDPNTNIMLGTKLLAELRGRYGDDAQRVYSAYNSGKPDLYKTSTQVGANVARFMRNLEAAVKSHPFVASSGLAGVLMAGAALWVWGKK